MRTFGIALRTLCRRAGFALLAIAMLTIGIGTASVVFSICDAVLLRPLPVRAPEELVGITQHLPRVGVNHFLPYVCYRALHERATTLSAVFGETGQDTYFALTDPTPLDVVTVSAVTPDFFEALGVHALYGRTLLSSDAVEIPDMPPAVLSYTFWHKHFSGEPTITNHRSIGLNGHKFLIVGVMPRAFKGFLADASPDVRIPLSAWPGLANVKDDEILLEMAARVKRGVTRAQAEAECRAISRPLVEDFLVRFQRLSPEEMKLFLSHALDLDALSHGITTAPERYRSVLTLLSGCAGLVLLIVCLNVAGVLLLRLEERKREFAIRLAIGGSRLHIVRQVLTENLLLFVCGIVAGGGLAAVVMPLAVRIFPPARAVTTSLVTIAADAGPSKRAFLVVTLVAVVTMVLFTVGPAITVCRGNLQDLLRSARASAEGRGRRFLVAFQIGLCTFVLTLASLFVRTVHELRQTDPGFDVAHIVTFTGDLSRFSNRADFVRELIEQVRQIPGVASSGIASRGVMRGSGLLMTVAPAGERITSKDFLDTSLNRVTPGYLDALGLRILSGRDFSPADEPGPNQQPPAKAVVNQAFVERFFPSGSVLGRRFGGGATGIAAGQYEVIGVVSEAKYRTLREPIVPTFYAPQAEFSSFVLNVRTVRQPGTVIDPVRKIWQAVGPNVPLLEIHTMAEEVEQSTSSERLTAEVASLFGVVAMFLVGVGLYGVLAYFVGQRKREIAIRMALGGTRAAISLLILRQTVALLAIGIMLGIIAVLVAGPAYRSLLYGVAPLDPQSLAISGLFIALVGGLAAARPVYGATRIDPGAELKDDN